MAFPQLPSVAKTSKNLDKIFAQPLKPANQQGLSQEQVKSLFEISKVLQAYVAVQPINTKRLKTIWDYSQDGLRQDDQRRLNRGNKDNALGGKRSCASPGS